MYEKRIIVNIAKEIELHGGKMYYVGGYVRDKLLGIDNKDIDVEIHGITPDKLKEILSIYGEVNEIGASFGVYMIKGYDIDFTMPRTESKTGNSHTDFTINVDPFMGTEKACRRRDLTINALMEDVVTGEVIDHFNGIKDINRGMIKHIDASTFIEDPLRVLRVCQFASRLNFKVSKTTIKLCSQIDISSLPKERVLGELYKAIEKSKKLSIFFKLLKEMNQLKGYFYELSNLSDDEFMLMTKTLDSTLEKGKQTKEIVFSIICLFIKDSTFLSRLTNEKRLIKIVNKNVISCEVLFSLYPMIDNMEYEPSDMRAIAYNNKDNFNIFLDFISMLILKDVYEAFEKNLRIGYEQMKTPLIKSEDLVKLGCKPGKTFGIILDRCIHLQIDGCSKLSILTSITKEFNL